MKTPLVLCAILAFTTLHPASAEELQHLSGTLRKPVRPGPAFFIELDGASGTMALEGSVMRDFRAGEHVFVSGVIKTVRPQRAKPDGTPQQIGMMWYIFMDVRKARVISSAFGLDEIAVDEPNKSRAKPTAVTPRANEGKVK